MKTNTEIKVSDCLPWSGRLSMLLFVTIVVFSCRSIFSYPSMKRRWSDYFRCPSVLFLSSHEVVIMKRFHLTPFRLLVITSMKSSYSLVTFSIQVTLSILKKFQMYYANRFLDKLCYTIIAKFESISRPGLFRKYIYMYNVWIGMMSMTVSGLALICYAT